MLQQFISKSGSGQLLIFASFLLQRTHASKKKNLVSKGR